MAIGDLYIFDADSVFMLPAAHVDAGDIVDHWTRLGNQSVSEMTSFAIDPLGFWWAGLDGFAGHSLYTRLYNTGGRAYDHAATGTVGHWIGSSGIIQLEGRQIGREGIAGFGIDIRLRQYYLTPTTGGNFAFVRRNPGEAASHTVFANDNLPQSATSAGFAALCVRQSDQMIAAVGGRSLFLRTRLDNDGDSSWIHRQWDDGDDPILSNFQRVSFDAGGRLWIWDSGHVRWIVQGRDLTATDWRIAWTMPEIIAGHTVHRENLFGAAHDQRGGDWGMALGDDVVRGMAVGDTLILDAYRGSRHVAG